MLPPPRKHGKESKSNDSGSEKQSENKSDYQTKKNEYYTSRKRVSATSVTRLFKGLANIFSDRLGNDDSKKLPVVDKRLRKEIEDKKNAEMTMT
ncbi:MAG: hypothetical protein J6Q78_01295 [Clostridia bacterium]|nr:hypothetical protein [Clostridia bacterium]